MEPMKPMTPMKPMEPMKPMAPMTPVDPWWPKELGEPASTGAQNATRYAYFPDRRRLVVDAGGKQTTYDTGSYRIEGFGQQQGGSDVLSFQTSSGPVDLQQLQVV